MYISPLCFILFHHSIAPTLTFRHISVMIGQLPADVSVVVMHLREGVGTTAAICEGSDCTASSGSFTATTPGPKWVIWCTSLFGVLKHQNVLPLRCFEGRRIMFQWEGVVRNSGGCATLQGVVSTAVQRV